MDNQGYSMMEQNPGYDANPQSKIAMLEKQFKSARGQDRSAIFSEAVSIAKQNGLKEIQWEGSNVPIDLVEHTQKVARVAKEATQVAQAQSDYIGKGQATIHDESKAEFDFKELMSEPKFNI